MKYELPPNPRKVAQAGKSCLKEKRDSDGSVTLNPVANTKLLNAAEKSKAERVHYEGRKGFSQDMTVDSFDVDNMVIRHSHCAHTRRPQIVHLQFLIHFQN